MVPIEGLEPPRISPTDFESVSAANYDIWAKTINSF